MNKSNYKRTRAGVMAIKKFIARHMKVTDRDLDNVRLDNYLNNEMWFRGSRKPPAKIKVIARKEGDIVRVELAEMPDKWKFAKARHERKNKKAEKKAVLPKKKEEKEDKTESAEEKKDEQEKAKSVAVAGEKQMEMQAKTDKHVAKGKAPQIKRLALKK